MASVAGLAVLGVLCGVWFVGASFWNPDNTYYLNKAAHYASSPTRLRIEDYMFGIPGLIHYPYGNILSSYEPAAGVLSAMTGTSAATVTFRVFVPLSMAAVPFAVRFAADGLGVVRSHLAGAVGGAALLLMTSTGLFASQFGTASLGKVIGQTLLMPIVIGAFAHLVRRRDRLACVRAVFVVLCAVGLSPTLAIPVALVAVPFTVVAGWATIRDRRSGRQLAHLALTFAPLLVLLVLSAVGLVLQRQAGDEQLETGFQSFIGPREAWLDATVTRCRVHPVPDADGCRGIALPARPRTGPAVHPASDGALHRLRFRGCARTVVLRPRRRAGS